MAVAQIILGILGILLGVPGAYYSALQIKEARHAKPPNAAEGDNTSGTHKPRWWTYVFGSISLIAVIVGIIFIANWPHEERTAPNPPALPAVSNSVTVANPADATHLLSDSKPPKPKAAPQRKTIAPTEPIPDSPSPPQKTEQTCIGSNCAGTNNGTQWLTNNYGAPQPPPPVASISRTHMGPGQDMTESGSQRNNPGVFVSLTLSGIFNNPMFIVECDRPCFVTGGAVSPGTFTIPAPTYTITGRPRFGLIAFTTPSSIQPGQRVDINVRSADEKDITVIDARPYLLPAR
jgi:hypothetical protein